MRTLKEGNIPKLGEKTRLKQKYFSIVDYQQGTLNFAILEPKGPTVHSPC
jgi:hypothetical protein